MIADGRTEPLHRPPAQVKNNTMINSCKQTKEINKFQYVAIPSPRDVFNKYGERENKGIYTCGVDDKDVDAHFAGQSTISQIVHAQKSLDKATKSIK